MITATSILALLWYGSTLVLEERSLKPRRSWFSSPWPAS
jgi:hypothetical protein